MFYYGAQYFRPPNPLKQFWEEDFKKMKLNGFNIVKLWAMWSNVNNKEGVYDFDDLNRLAEIAEKNGIQVIFNTIIENAPYWLIQKHPEAMYKSAFGYVPKPQSRGNTPSGGWPGLCVHNQSVRAAAEKFFEKTAENFLGMSNLYAYDIWNETYFEPPGFFGPNVDTGLYCFCDATQRLFVEWLKNKYKTLKALNEAWYRCYSDWNEVYPPLQRGGYPDMLDWLTFRTEDYTGQMKWRYDTFRRVDKNILLISHTGGFGSQARTMTDTAKLAEHVDEWGMSSFYDIYDRSGNVTEHMLYRLDIARSDSKGKKFWQSELKGGQNTGGNAHYPIRRSPMAREHTMRAWNWCVLMSGAKGLMYWQYRPEQLGPETPGNGLTDLAGRETERLRQAAWFAKFINKNEFIGHSVPVKGEIGILRLDEMQKFTYILDKETDWYDKAIDGAYRAFSTFNYVVDIISAEDMTNYNLVYIPFPQMIERKNIEKIRAYVDQGGQVVTEACTAHYIDGGYCSFSIPGEMTDVFGCEEFMAESLFDVNEKPLISFDNGLELKTAVYQEWLNSLGGKIIGKYADGSAAVVENSYGKGKTIMTGTYPSIGFDQEPTEENRKFFKYILDWAGKEKNIETGDRDVKARMHTYSGNYYLYIVNLKNEEKEIKIEINPKFGNFINGFSTVSGTEHKIYKNTFKIELKNCEGDIIQLKL